MTTQSDMKTIASVSEMQKMCSQIRMSGRRIGLVPTMGFLHEGHLSLIRIARQNADVVVVSIFVNPIQFGPAEDLAKYPRDIDRDTRLCIREGVDILFCPIAEDMYDVDHGVFVEEAEISHSLCGLSRPGHFRGVLTVVAKLFNIVQPGIAVFGQKDAQQCRLVQKMVRDLNFQLEIVVGATVREADGLAMSSRNVYMSSAERQIASRIPRALELAKHLYESGVRDGAVIRGGMTELLGNDRCVQIDYIDLRDPGDWESVDVLRGPVLVAMAVRVGKVRLIDNMLIGSDAVPPGSLPRPLPQ